MLTTAVTLLAATAALLLVPSTAHALVAPTFSSIDASTPGHVTFDVTAPDSAYVAAWLRVPYPGTDLAAPVFVPTNSGVASFDLETWGMSTGVILARPCGGSTVGTCGGYAVSNQFTAKDVQPVITFPADDTIGPGQTFVVDTVDPDGGGLLRAFWWGFGTTLTRGGSAAVNLDVDSGGVLSISRCSSTNPSVCRSTGISHGITVNKVLGFSVSAFQLGSISPVLGTKLAPLISSNEGSSTYTFDWHVDDAATGDTVPGVSGTITGLKADSAGRVRPLVDPGALTVNKAYKLVGVLSYDQPDFGTIASGLMRFSFVIDTVAPSRPSLTVDGSPLYPYRDRYRDKVMLTIRQQPAVGNVLLIKVLNADQQVVHTFRSTRTDATKTFGWTGDDASGHRVPGGKYTVSATIADAAGNTSTAALGSVTVVRERIASRVFKHTYTATGTMEHAFVGKCSTLARPSSRGWAGSLGYYSNARCSKTVDDSVVWTTHAAKMPAAMTYDDLDITVYGGATRLSTRHIAYLSYFNREHDWGKPRMLEPGTGWHVAGSVNGASYVFDDRYVVWGVFNVKGSHYDVKSFAVKLRYTTLVAE